MKKISLLVSEKHEGTAYPWWIIVDPKQLMRCDPHEVAGMITGPFFSREEAQDFLKASRRNFSHRAVVYCHSGCFSRQYKEAFRNGVKCDEAMEAQ